LGKAGYAGLGVMKASPSSHKHQANESRIDPAPDYIAKYSGFTGALTQVFSIKLAVASLNS